jgi:hypothetical protein
LAEVRNRVADPRITQSPGPPPGASGALDSARQRIDDLTLVMHLADDLVIGDPQRQRPRTSGMSERVSGQLSDRDHQIVDPARR